MGNIIGIYESTGKYRQLVAYTYDSQNQLLSETYYTYSGTSTTPATTTVYEYTYDTAGNILTASKNGTVTQTYTYGDSNWADKLTRLNGQTITYDASGNPTSWNNGKSYTGLTWINGRQLSAITTGGKTTTYAYDADGIRSSKTVGSTVHTYLTQSGKVVRETIGSGSTAKVLDFIYDESGKPFALKYSTNNGSSFTTYYYVLNLQGDVVKLVTSSGTAVAIYTYDAWGNLLTSSGTMASVNPLRYRGYYYDNETGFYYLQSRYYDPTNHRFLNADVYASTGQGILGTNMFIYCRNNPANKTDTSGCRDESAVDEIIEAYSDEIIAAGEEYDVDPAAIAVCIYAEQVLNYDWKDQLFDFALWRLNTSIGLGQVRVETAKMLEDAGYIEKTAGEFSLFYWNPRKQKIAAKLLKDSENIRYVAAYLRYWIDVWGDTYDISGKPEILATLYNLGKNANAPNTSPRANSFGEFAQSKYEHIKTLLY